MGSEIVSISSFEEEESSLAPLQLNVASEL